MEQHVDAADERQAPTKDLKEFGDGSGIEPITDPHAVKAAKLEKFMNEVITIQVSAGRDVSDNPVIVPNVNGVNQPIVRGVPSKVKRKYVEALARCTVTKYKQEKPDPSNPDQLKMNSFTSSETPFTVIHDPSGRVGLNWVQKIIAEAARG